jgi:hypothetical protein
MAAVLGMALSGGAAPARAGAGAEGAPFLHIPVGARPAALGGAYDALAVDAYAPALNPAGLGFLPSAGLAATHLSYLDAVTYDAFSAALPVRSKARPTGGGFGGSIQYLSPGKVSGTDASGNPTGDFNGYYYAAGLAYGRAVTPRLSLGAGGKMIGAGIAGATARAYAADLGAMYRLGEWMTFSVVGANLGGPLKFVQNSDPLPRQVRVGAAVQAGSSLILTAQGVDEVAGLGFNAGAEWRPFDPLALRAGYQSEAVRQLSGMAGLTLGVGLRCAGIGLDYAWVPMGDLGSTSFFSLTLAFGKKGGRAAYEGASSR